MVWDSSTSFAASSSGVRAISSRYMPTRSRSAISPPTARTLLAAFVPPEPEAVAERRATARVAMRAPLLSRSRHPPGCPASVGNNDWNPDRIPMRCGDFLIVQYPVPRIRGGQMSYVCTEVQVRAGTEADLAALTDIYNHFVRETAITFDTVAFTPEQRLPWLRSHPKDGPHRLLVAQDVPSARILGYATSSPFRPKPAYSTSVEVSVYCAPSAGRRGIGTLLYQALFEALAGEDVHRAYAGIARPNEAS